ncbi:membrane associated rhomboid family serine protease [Luteimonas cucumeris]|uniref:Membrane associated rhomboid family serine protease n=1 Tax=Luteimonas cucumeris TaxID=985012 RepID=A0A562KVK4_9GAMM|nr:rhomboid family intramembrane serine protease [Luteimonas cucumeris]TWH99458.1 membrane associated rhomboid family serine protease [Luteimonas cucumeris]
MHLPLHDAPADATAQGRIDKRRILRALNASLAFVLLLAIAFVAQHAFDLSGGAISPLQLRGLPAILSAPLLHGSFEHITANAISLILLGTLAGSVYPRATLRALPLLWLGSGLGAWLLGEAGTRHLGASGLTHGLMFLVFVLGLLRRDRPAIAAAMIAFMLYGGMLLTVLPREPGISWQAHLGGALAGVLAAFLFRHRDPPLPRRKYSWEIEEELAADAARLEREQFEPDRPRDVPVLWQRTEEPRGVVLPFPPRKE